MSPVWKPPKLTGRRSTDVSAGLFLVIILVMVFSALREKRDRASYESAPVPGDPAPAYSAFSLDGTAVSIGDFHGKVVLLSFWTRDCPACVDQFQEFQELRDDLGVDGLELVTVNLEDGDRGLVQSYLQALGHDWLNLFDDPSHVGQVFGWGRLIPKTILVNRDGTVAAWWRGKLDPISPENRALIGEALSGRAVWKPRS